MAKNIDPIVKEALDNLTKTYTESQGKTKAGRFLRLIVSIIPLGTIVDALVHKNGNTSGL